jgi:hypothetical protein
MLNEYAEALEAQYAVLFPVACHTPRSRSPMYHGQARCLPVNAWGILYV